MFLYKSNFGRLGAFFFIEVRQQHHLLCTEQCLEVVSKVSILLSTFLCCYSKFFQEHMLEKTRWHTFSGFGPASFSYRASTALYPLKLESNPCNNIFKSITNTIGKISLQNLTKKSNYNFD